MLSAAPQPVPMLTKSRTKYKEAAKISKTVLEAVSGTCPVLCGREHNCELDSAEFHKANNS